MVIFRLHCAMSCVNVWTQARETAQNGGDFERGETYTITGTIKAHEEYKGERQTALTRCKVQKGGEE